MSVPREGSALRPARDPDDVRQQHKRVAAHREQVLSERVAVENLTRKVESIRRRILGGATNPATNAAGTFRGEFDPTAVYNLQDITIISLGANQGTFVYINSAASTGSTGSNPTLPPYTGGGQWAQLPGGLLGQWM